MIFFGLIKFAFQSLWQRKLRTILSIFAVVVGTILITIMVSLGIGLQKLVVEKLRAIPTLSAITVIKKEADTQTQPRPLDNQAKREIEKINFVKKAHPVLQFYALPAVKGREAAREIGFQAVLGLDEEQAEEVHLSAGSKLGNKKGAVLIAPSLKKYFGFEYPERMVGQIISLKIKRQNEGVDFRIVGIIDKGKSPDNFAVIMSLDQALNFLSSSLGLENFAEHPLYNRLQVEVESFDKTEEAAKEIQKLGFETITLEQVIQQVVKYFRFFELGLGVFGLIVLGVASLGIMNMMIMSIYERTREIGVLKAVGARAMDVIKIFSLEAALIGFIGGLAGVLISSSIILFMGKLANIWLKKYGGINEGIRLFSLPLWLSLIIILFTTFIGFMSGLYPAIRAARMDPVKALREK